MLTDQQMEQLGDKVEKHLEELNHDNYYFTIILHPKKGAAFGNLLSSCKNRIELILRFRSLADKLENGNYRTPTNEN